MWNLIRGLIRNQATEKEKTIEAVMSRASGFFFYFDVIVMAKVPEAKK